MKDKVSVIVPVYNAEVFLPQTIESITNQTYQNLEIILVNDCSTDKSLSVLEQFAQHDDRIKVIDKAQNEGVDYARFSGIEIATGDYITFLDADDWFEKDAISMFVNIARTMGVDIVYANHWRVFSQRFGLKKLRSLNTQYINRIISGKEKDSLFISFFGVNIIPVNLCGTMFKRKLFTSDIQRSGLQFGEDLAVAMQLYHNAESFFMTSAPAFYYRWGGVTAKFQPNFLPSCKKLFERKLSVSASLNFDEGRRTSIIEMVNCLATYIVSLVEYYPEQRSRNIDSLIKEVADSVYSSFESVRHDPYFKAGELNTACVNRNMEEAYIIAERLCNMPKNRARLLIKKLASSALKHIKL